MLSTTQSIVLPKEGYRTVTVTRSETSYWHFGNVLCIESSFHEIVWTGHLFHWKYTTPNQEQCNFLLILQGMSFSMNVISLLLVYHSPSSLEPLVFVRKERGTEVEPSFVMNERQTEWPLLFTLSLEATNLGLPIIFFNKYCIKTSTHITSSNRKIHNGKIKFVILRR